MRTVVDRQVQAYRESVEAAPPEQGGEIQDLVHAGIAVARLIIRHATQYQEGARPTPAVAAAVAGRCWDLLGLMVKVQRALERVKAAGLELRFEDEFQDAVVELRELIAFLTGVAEGVPPLPDVSEADRAAFTERFRRLAESHPPPQSWFEEDFDALRGPGRS